MKNNLLITLGVMVLLTIIVGFTAYNLTNGWTNVSEDLTRIISKGLLWEEVASSIDRQVKRTDVFIISPSQRIQNEVNDLDKTITERLSSLKYLSNPNSSDELDISFVTMYYKRNIFDLINQIIDKVDKNASKDEIIALSNKLTNNNYELSKQINILKADMVPDYQERINSLRNYSSGVTITITMICVLLGLILMAISTNHVSTLYERIEKQANHEKLISELTTAVCSTLDLEVIFSIATREITKALNVDRCMILEAEESDKFDICNEYLNEKDLLIEKDEIPKNVVEYSKHFLLDVKENLKPIASNDIKTDKLYTEHFKVYSNTKISSFIIIPIILHKNNLYGYIQLENYGKPKKWTKDNIDLITGLANQLSIAISNAQHYKNAKIKTEEASSLTQQLEQSLMEMRNINKELMLSNELNVKIQEAERLRIAQDLHDESIQGLIGLIRKTDNSINNNCSFNPSEIHDELKLITSQIRKICQNLRPSILDDLGLHSAIEWLLDDLEKFGVVPHLLIDDEHYKQLPVKMELTIFRVVQELTNNIKKHSKAENAWLTLIYSSENISLMLSDDGCGFEYKEEALKKTLGLIGIKERIKNVAGNIEIDTSVGEGTKVKISIPLATSISDRIEEEVSL